MVSGCPLAVLGAMCQAFDPGAGSVIFLSRNSFDAMLLILQWVTANYG